VIGWIALVVLAVLFRDRDGGVFRARWWGILGLIGWAYLVAAFVYLFARDRMRYLLPAWLILLGLCLLRSGTRGGEALLALPRGNFLDALLELFHLGNGALAALAVGGVLLSVCHVKYFSVDKGKGYVAFVLLFILLLGVGFAAHSVWITSKIQATPPWVLYCSAISVGMYALLTFLVDKGGARWFRLIRVAGTATLTCYLMPYVAYSISAIFHIQLPEGMHAGLLGILSCVAFSLLMLALAWGIGKIGLRLKI
jgi:hypothetical protein